MSEGACFYAQKRNESVGRDGHRMRRGDHPVYCPSKVFLVVCSGRGADLRWDLANSLLLEKGNGE